MQEGRKRKPAKNKRKSLGAPCLRGVFTKGENPAQAGDFLLGS
jgi:hypothetical protein